MNHEPVSGLDGCGLIGEVNRSFHFMSTWLYITAVSWGSKPQNRRRDIVPSNHSCAPLAHGFSLLYRLMLNSKQGVCGVERADQEHVAGRWATGFGSCARARLGDHDE